MVRADPPRVEVRFAAPRPAPLLDGVSVVEATGTTMALVVDTARTPIRLVLDALLDGAPVEDISVVDPPLEQVIAEVYGLQRP